MQEQDEGYTNFEFQVLSLVAEDLHAEQRTHTAPDGGHQQECGLRYAPTLVTGLVLVNAIEDKREQRDDNEVAEQKLGHRKGDSGL